MANVIITLMKDEDNLVVDFVLHHLAIGFDKIVVFDDMSVTPVSAFLSGLPNDIREKVHCYRLSTDFYSWKGIDDEEFFDNALFAKFPASKQWYFYNLGLARFVEPTDWVAFIDADEFVWLGEYDSIGQLRAALQSLGFSAVIFPMLMYGHGCHIVPPADNNICAFLWRAANFYGHGKFFAQSGAIRLVDNVHFPTLYSSGLICGTNLCAREKEFEPGTSPIADLHIPHIKHYIIQDVVTCFRRRLRGRISQTVPVSPTTPAWLDRIDMLRWTSFVADPIMAAAIILTRLRAGLEIAGHARALSSSLDSLPQTERMGSGIDFSFLRTMLEAQQSDSDGALLFRYFRQTEPDIAMLRFMTLPDSFDAHRYKALYRDLTSLNLSVRELEQHYLNYGQKEGRAF
jgi:hypothetical protein